jgi:hypothetical protein
MAAMLHPSQFGGAIVMGGYFRPDFGPKYEPFAPGSAADHRYDLVDLARKAPIITVAVSPLVSDA